MKSSRWRALLGATGVLVLACGARTEFGPGPGQSGAGGSNGSAGNAGKGGAAAGGPNAGSAGLSDDFCIECQMLPPPDCMQRVCDPASRQCRVEPSNDGGGCNPEDLCLVNAVCSKGQCVGTPLVCPSDLCSNGRVCQDGVCVGGVELDCSMLDGVCTQGACDPVDGQCRAEPVPAGTLCDDADACTQGDACTSGSCAGKPIESCIHDDGCCPAACAGANDNDCVSEEVVLDAVNRGWWSSNVAHDSTNDNTYTGRYAEGLYNSYFIFNLAGLAGTVVSAELVLEQENYYGNELETVSLWDVTTNATTLEASGFDSAILSDLQSGNQYGSFELTADDIGTFHVIALSAQAVSDLNAALGGSFAVGAHLETLSPSMNDGVRFSELSEARVHELVLEFQ
jgi:hypothetical protein